MKKVLFTIIAITCVALASNAQYVKHAQTYYGIEDGWAENTTLTKALFNDGYVIAPYGLVGDSNLFGLIKVDENFDVDWQQFYNSGSVYGPEYVTKDIFTDSIKHEYVVCGLYHYYYGTPSFISVFDSLGSILWLKKYPNIESINAIIPISFNSSLSYVACGKNSQGRAIIFGLDSVGNTVWAKKVTSFDYSEYTDLMQVRYSSDIVVTGTREIDHRHSSIVTRISTQGNIIHSYEYYCEDIDLKFNAVCVNLTTNYNDPTLHITGSYGNEDESDVCMVKVAFYDGTVFSANHYDINQNSTHERGSDIMKLKNRDEIAITGESYISDFGLSDTNGFILRLDTNGNSLSSTIFGDTYENRLSKIIRNIANDGYVMAGHIIEYMYDAPYFVEAFNTVQEECYNHELPADPMDFVIDTAYVYHGVDTLYDVPDSVNSTNSTLKKVTICEKKKPGSKMMNTFETDTDDNLLISPSITSDFVYISNIDGAIEYEIYSSTGKLLLSSFSNSKSSIGLDMTNYSKGIYIIKILYNNDMITRKIIKI